MTDKRAGQAWVFGDDVNTDYIISSKRKRDTLDAVVLSEFLMEDLRPGFGKLVGAGDFLVAGRNFGCGSAMEIATEVIKAADIKAVLAKSFSRTFFRNGINGGLLMLTLDTGGTVEGDQLAISEDGDATLVRNLTQGHESRVESAGSVLMQIVRDGGLIAHLQRHGGFALDGNA